MADPVGLVRLTAKQIGPEANALPRPKIYVIAAADLVNLRKDGSGGSVIEDGNSPKGQRKIVLYEKPRQVSLKINVTHGVTTGIEDDDMDLGITAAGSVLTAGTDLTKYYNKITALTATTVAAVVLPAPVASGDVCVINNGGSAAASVFPHGASAYIDSEASGAVKALAAGRTMHFVASSIGASGVWQSALDEDNTV